MKRKTVLTRKTHHPKSVRSLPDLEHANAAVLNSLTSLDAQRGYRHPIDEFVDWYCSEPRLALNRILTNPGLRRMLAPWQRPEPFRPDPLGRGVSDSSRVPDRE
jgi:hypothetical protein